MSESFEMTWPFYVWCLIRLSLLQPAEYWIGRESFVKRKSSRKRFSIMLKEVTIEFLTLKSKTLRRRQKVVDRILEPISCR